MRKRSEEEIISSLRLVTEPFRDALNGDWEGMKRFYEKNRELAVLPVTLTNDTPLHIAIYSGSKSPLEELLCIVPNDLFTRQNDKLNTPLHEAGVIGNVEAAQVLVNRSAAQLDVRNILGETPMFRAAAFGVTKMVKYLAAEVRRVQGDMDVQRLRYDQTSILHIAIYGQHFETALWLLRNDQILGELKDKDGQSCLHLLAKMPSAFKSGYSIGKLTALIYFCLPNDDDDEARLTSSQSNNLDCGQNENNYLYHSRYLSTLRRAIAMMYYTFWKCIARGWPKVKTIWKEKRKHEMALRLAKLLVVEDTSWEQTHTKPDMGSISFGDKLANSGKEKEMEIEMVSSNINLKENKEEGTKCDNITVQQPQGETMKSSTLGSPTTPLLLATRSGIVEIVKEILQVYPQAVEHVSEKGQHIMHVAIRYRQKEIFCLVKEIMRIPMARLVRKIDNDGNTLLHHVADNTGCGGRVTQPNPALQLQDELKWFEGVRNLIPSYYEMHHNNNDEVAQEFFERTHSELLKEAQNWLKRTSESCSVIAVLIATVAFTAAYTVPGGSDDKTGLPILLHDPFFLVFTVMDVVSLVSSLTSVVMFISIVTSPFQLQDFRHSLPRKLTLAFTFLFFAVAATMLAFSATVILIIQMKKRWTTTVVYAFAFVPVTVFALLQFPLHVAFMGTLRYTLSLMKKVLPWNFVIHLLIRCDHATSFRRNELNDMHI